MICHVSMANPKEAWECIKENCTAWVKTKPPEVYCRLHAEPGMHSHCILPKNDCKSCVDSRMTSEIPAHCKLLE